MQKAQFESELPSHLTTLRALARRLVGHPDDAQDVLQEALLQREQGAPQLSRLNDYFFRATQSMQESR